MLRAWRPLALCAVWAVAPAGAQPPAPELSGYVTLATDARKHGLSQLDDGAALRLGLDYQHAGGPFAGAVLGNVSYASEASRSEPRETALELYAGYLWRGGDWSFTGALGHYRYPGAAYDYDYSELSTVFEFRDRYFYRFTYTDDLLSTGNEASGHELGFTTALPADLELGASIGRFDTRGRYGYTHYNIGLSKLVGRFGLDLRRYEASREIVGRYGSTAAERWVFSLSYAIRPRP